MHFSSETRKCEDEGNQNSLIQEVLSNLNLNVCSTENSNKKIKQEEIEHLYKKSVNNICSLENSKMLQETGDELITLLKTLIQHSSDTERIAEIIIRIAGVLDKLGEKQQALNFYQQGLLLQTNYSVQNNENTLRKVAQTYSSISNLFGDLERYEEAQEAIVKALNIALETFGEEDIDTAQYYLTLGIWQSTEGKLEEAISNMNKAIEIQTNLLGENNGVLGKSFMELGNVYHAWDKPLEALENYERCIEIFTEHTNGEFDEELASVWDSLADLSILNESWEDAIDYYNEALDVRKGILERSSDKKEEHKAIAILYEKIAECYKEKGDFSQAKQTYEKAINEYNQVYEKESPELVPFYQLLGYYAYLDGSFEESMNYYKIALGIYSSNIDGNDTEDDFEVIEMYKLIADSAFQGQNFKESINYNMRVMEFYRKRKYMAKMEDVCERIAKAYERLGMNEEAIEVYRKIFVEFLDYFGKDDSRVKKFYEALKDLYQLEERFEEIEELDNLLANYKS